MMTNMKVIIDLPHEIIKELALLGEKEHKSRDALIHEAIQAYLITHKPTEMPNAFGLWAKNNVATLEYERILRDEWSQA